MIRIFILSLLFLFTLSIVSQDRKLSNTITSIKNTINKSDYPNALIIVDSVLENETKILKYDGETKFGFLSKIYGFKGQIEWMLNNSYNDSYFLKSIEYAKIIKDSTDIGISYLNLGRIHEAKSNYPKSIEYYINALPYVQENCNLLSRTLDNIGYSLSTLEKYEKAYEYINQAYVIAEKCDNDPQKIFMYNSLAAFYIKAKMHEDSISYYLEKATLLANKIEHKEGLSITNSNYSDYYITNKKFKEAIKYSKFGLDEAIEIGDFESQAQSLLQLGGIHFELDQIKTSINYYEEANIIINKIKAQSLKAEALLALSKSYKALGDYETTHNYYKQYTIINDSLENLNKLKEFNNTLIKYETDKIKAEKEVVEKENVIQQNKIKQDRNYYITASTLFILIIIILIGIGLYINSRKKAQLIKLELSETKNRLQMERKLRESEIKSIRSQLSPHFIFNAINSIQALIMNENYKSAYKYLNLFSGLIRNTLTFSEEDFISFDTETNFINSYLELEKLRFNQDFTYSINSNNIPKEIQLPSIIIQPFIENSIKHGLFNKTGNKNLAINFKLVGNDFINCEIIDNGIGRIEAQKIKQRQEEVHSSFSTGAIERRITILKTFYGPKVNYDLIDLEKEDGSAKGTKVSITLPIKIEI